MARRAQRRGGRRRKRIVLCQYTLSRPGDPFWLAVFVCVWQQYATKTVLFITAPSARRRPPPVHFQTPRASRVSLPSGRRPPPAAPLRPPEVRRLLRVRLRGRGAVAPAPRAVVVVVVVVAVAVEAVTAGGGTRAPRRPTGPHHNTAASLRLSRSHGRVALSSPRAWLRRARCSS